MHPRSNITKEQLKALKELKNDSTRMNLTADKGVSMVVMDRDEYIKEAVELQSQPTYKAITADPTTKYKKCRLSTDSFFFFFENNSFFYKMAFHSFF